MTVPQVCVLVIGANSRDSPPRLFNQQQRKAKSNETSKRSRRHPHSRRQNPENEPDGITHERVMFMARNRDKVRYYLDSGDIKNLSDNEIRAMLRAADELIDTGGRSMLAKILKGSKDKKLLSYGLENCPVYGYYQALTLPAIGYRIDWMIENDYLKIVYNGKLPVIVFTEIGWEIERETYTEELLQKLTLLLNGKDYSFVQELTDRNRGMILLLLGKIRQTQNAGFIPLLKEWQTLECKKVRREIENVIDYLIKKDA